jgi:hypothetical protein
VVFEVPFDAEPSVVVIPNFTSAAGTIIEVSATNVTPSGFTAVMGTSARPLTTFTSRWIAAEQTQ